jgi:hypothetical protein
MNKTVNLFAAKPKILFLTDGLGALLTAFLLFVVLRNFNGYFGVSQKMLTWLSMIAAIFCFYSMICFVTLKGNWAPFIKAIGIANLMYCITTGLLLVYSPGLTVAGAIYFLAEIAIIGVLVYVEFQAANAIRQNEAKGNG